MNKILGRPGYREAIEWLAGNDDNGWLEGREGDSISVAAALVRDLWQVDDEKLKRDILRALKKVYPDHPAVLKWLGKVVEA